MEKIDELLKSLNWRYATKKFELNKKIPDPIWNALEESLVLTPSSYGLQTWKFIVITDSKLRETLKQASWNQPQVTDCSHYLVIACLKNVDQAHIQNHIDRIVELRGVSADSLDKYKAGMIKDLIDGGPRSKWVSEWSARQAYIALGNVMTCAALLGIDACPMEGFEPAQYDKILNLENTPYRSIVSCAFGYRDPSDKFASAKKVRFSKNYLFERK